MTNQLGVALWSVATRGPASMSLGGPPSDELLADLPELPVLAAFAYAGTDLLEGALRQGCNAHRVPFLRVDEREHLDAHDPLACTLVSLELLEQLDRQDRGRRRRLRAYEREALELVEDLRPERPLYVAIGLNSSRLEMLLERLTDFDPGAPLWLIGCERPEVDDEIEASVRVQAELDTWADLRRWFGDRSHPLLRDDLSEIAIRVGDARVTLRDIFEDDYLRIDQQWRVITTRALAPEVRDEVGRFELFRRYMFPDETTDAATAEEDYWEWWAIAEGIPVPRSKDGVAWHWRDVESCLEDAAAAEAVELRVVWLPAEPASGATKVAHHLAFDAARAGYPTLILKQGVTDELRPGAVSDFLLNLGERAAAAADDPQLTSRPVLIVIDHQHLRLDGVRKLQGLLAQQRKRAVFLVVQRVWRPGKKRSVERQRADIEAEGVDLYGPHQAHVLPVLRNEVTPDDVDEFRRHADTLRQKDRVPLPERSEAGWKELRDHRRTVMERMGWHFGMRSKEQADFVERASGTPVFWEVIGHFLVGRDEDPLRTWFRDRLEYIRIDDRSRAVLLEIAKLALCELAAPVRSIADWLGRQPSLPPSPPASSDASPLDTLDLEQLRAAWSTRPHLFSKKQASGEGLRDTLKIVEGLEEHGWIRRFVDPSGDEWIAAQFTSNMARALLGAYLAVVPKAAVPWDVFELDVEQDGYKLVAELMAALRPHRANLVFAHMLSEHLYKGRDEGAYWGRGLGEERLKAYAKLNRELLDSSRVLQHHKSMVARRTTFPAKMPAETKLARLTEARELLERALRLPGGEQGHRDEHPGHMLTTLAFVLDDLARLQPEQALVLRREARERLEEALLLVHGSQHTRQKLAELLRAMAERLIREAHERGVSEALESEIPETIARGLQLLSWNAPRSEAHLKRWREERERLAALGGDDLVMAMISHLCERGDEHGYLLRAELMALEEGDNDGNDYLRDALEQSGEALPPAALRELAAANYLRDALKQHGVESLPRAALRCAEFLRADPSGAWEERYALLSTVAVLQTVRLDPMHEFEAAYLAYQTGRYDEGRRRFRDLRASGKARHLFVETPYLWKTAGTPLHLTGRVATAEPGDAWLSVLDSGGTQLFRAPFNPRHFEREGSRLRPRAEVPIYVRFTPTGVKAVPVRFFRISTSHRHANR
ncbi:MAG: hypothetical protein R3B82_20920 [Sandaracinaceae bacterium]